MKVNLSRPALCFAFIACSALLYGQKTLTRVHGIVRDSLSNKALPYASISFENAKQVVRSDINGNFYLETEKQPKRLRISYVGYESRQIAIQPGVSQDLLVLMKERDAELLEVTIRPQKYSRKNNPAVDLVEEVFRHKDQNRKEGLDFYSVEKYEKLQMDLNNITDEYRNRWYFRPFRFIFNNVDTNSVTQKVALPFYLRERLLKAYYRKTPLAQKAILNGQRQSGFAEEEEDDLGVSGEGVSTFLNSTFSEVDIYEPKIQLLGTEFIGPLSSMANSLYRFYIVDTVEYGGQKCADLFFAPKNKADLAFMGNILVALDSTYAVVKAELGVPKEINLNFVSDLHIEQEFERVPDQKNPGGPGKLMLRYDAVTVDLKVLKKNKGGRSLLTHKSSWYRTLDVNNPLPDSLFKGPELLQDDTGAVKKRPAEWWAARRYVPLNGAQQFVDKMVDSLKKVPIYRFMTSVGKVMGTGYQRVAFVDIGALGNVYSFNDIEGTRLRLGARTNSRLYKPLVLDAYGAYGLRDLTWKYQVGATYSLNGKVPRTFPQHLVSASWQKDLRTPGFSLGRFTQDNPFVSVQRAAQNRMLFNTVLRLEYRREYKNRFSYSIQALRKTVNTAGTLTFALSGGDPANPEYAQAFNTAEMGLFLRYAPRQEFYNGPNARTNLPNRYPVFSLSFRNGFKGVADGAYAYQKILFTVSKRFQLAPLGVSRWTLNSGRTWGSVPYPLLELPPANQSYFYDNYAFNLMNFLEFVSDKYVSLHVQHNFNGFLLNRVPLVRRLQLREMFSFKMLYGGLDNRNNPALTPGLFAFPADENGASITQPLDKRPFLEISAGLSNIFKFLRVDYVWRLNYLELPNAPSWGIRLGFSPQF